MQIPWQYLRMVFAVRGEISPSNANLEDVVMLDAVHKGRRRELAYWVLEEVSTFA